MKLLLVSLLSFSTLIAETYISTNVIQNINLDNNSKSSKLIKNKILLLEKFSTLNLKIPATFIVYTHSQKNIVMIEIDENFTDAIDTSIVNKIFTVKASRNIVTKLPINITIYSSEGINKILTQSSLKLEVNGIKEPRFELLTKGISNIKFNQGSVDKLLINSRGKYEINLKKINTKNVSIQAKGIGQIEVSVSNLLEVKLTALAKVYYFGQPKIKKNLKGLSQLNRR